MYEDREVALREALLCALALSARWPETDEPRKTRETLCRAIIWYDDKFGDANALSPLVTGDGIPAYEVPFAFPLWPDSDTLLCGNIDGVVDFGGELWVLERKTTKNALSRQYWAQYDPNLQIDIYALAARLMWPEWDIRGVLVEATQVGVTFCRTERKEFRRSPERLEETLVSIQREVRDFQYEYEQANYPGAKTPFNPKPNFASCMANGGCPYRQICTSEPSLREWEIKTQWRPREDPWNPLNKEGATNATSVAETD